MRSWLFFTLFFLMQCGIHSQVKNVTLLDNWVDSNMQEWYGDEAFNEVWGFVEEGNEYAVIGSANGTTICMITDDNQLREVQFIEGRHTSAIHRDYHDYDGYLYEVCDQGASTLRIYDLHYLPDSIHLVYDDNEFIITSHNIFIDSSSALLYACGVKDGLTEDAVKVLSLNDPVHPSFVYNYNFVDYVHDAYIRNDTAYFNCANEGFRVANFSNPTMPLPLGSLTFYPDKGYNHSGWLSEDGKTYVLCDENVGHRFKILDVSDLTDIQVLALDQPPTSDYAMPHNVILKNGLAYFSYYNDGLQIYDIRHPNNPKRIAYYDTYSGDDDPTNIFKGAWGIYSLLPSGRLLVSDRTSGLFLFKFNAPPFIQNDNDEVQIFPNPMNGEGYFYLYSITNTLFTFSVFNSTGQLVDEIEGDQDYTYLNTTSWANGVYLYVYQNSTSGAVIQGKFVVANGE